ncbi:MAG: AI-2E family transporter [Clostridiales bacterium]|nr:AI-2E family transporter [Clostridiales bacterium]
MSDHHNLENGFPWKKVIAFLVVVVLLIMIWYMLDVALITFIMAFVFYHLARVCQIGWAKICPRRIPEGLLIAVLYVVVLGAIAFVLVKAVPHLAGQIGSIVQMVTGFDIKALENVLPPEAYGWITRFDFSGLESKLTKGLATVAAKIGTMGINLFISTILSFFILLEREKIKRFGARAAESKIGFIYNYLLTFGQSFVRTFGKVMKVQVLIAFINSLLSMLMLGIMGFPNIPALGVMIFCLGLIPVAGVIISLIPLCVIGFTTGGIMLVIAVLIMIAILHAIEAYVLNPKLMSSRVELPVCFVFIILIVGEHYLGVWGLLIGVPLFVFLMDITGVKYSGTHKSKRQLEKAEKKKNKCREESH